MKAFLVFASLLASLFGWAATTPPVPPVTPVKVVIAATDPTAAESGPSTGLFTIHRTGSTAEPLTVFYRVGGSAVAPGDYHELPGSLTIPAGASSASILVTPVDDAIAEDDETVVVTVVSPIQLLTPGPSTAALQLYEIGQARSATVVIKDNDLGQVSLPTVNIRATDAKAAEPNKVGKIRISRIGDVHEPLAVAYEIVSEPIELQPTAGELGAVAGPIVQVPAATSGVDYQPLPGTITIPAGEKSVTILIQPIDDTIIEGREHVTLKLKTSKLYNINQPDTATVLIADNDPVNTPPTVAIVSPKSGASFQIPAAVLMVAQASDKEGGILKVEFFANGKSVGVTKSNPASASPINPHQITWKPEVAGEYTLTATATDDRGAVASSEPVKIKVIAAVPPPSVTISASQPQVLESDPAHPGTLKVTRTGNLQAKLNVRYSVSGTAENGGDYVKLPGVVTLPAGASSALIAVVPVPDKAIEGKETVILTLVPPAAVGSVVPPAPEDNYVVGSPKAATVTIYEQLPNQSPKVAIITPKNDATVDAGTTLTLLAEASDPGGKVQEVTFLVDEKPIGTATQAPYSIAWDHLATGQHVLVAVVKDDRGAMATSAAVRITVRPATQATLVITSPKDGATFTTPADITILATAIDPKSYISRVEFYANDALIGVSQITFIRAPDPRTPIQHTFEWLKVPAGKYRLVAKAKDSAGAVATSAPVTITVLPVLVTSPFKLQGVAPGNRVSFEGQLGRYSIQSSEDLLKWTEIGTVENTEGPFDYVVPAAEGAPHQFYRAVPK